MKRLHLHVQVTDPQGISWGHFRTIENIPLFRENAANNGKGAMPGNACHAGAQPAALVKTAGACS